MKQPIGPKELRLQEMREARFNERAAPPPPSKTELREKIAKVKGGGGRKKKSRGSK